MRPLTFAVLFAALLGTACPEKKADPKPPSPDAAVAAVAAAPKPPPVPTTGPRLLEVGPRYVSNQTAQPLALYGEELSRGAVTVELKGPDGSFLSTSTLEPVQVDPRHLYVKLPPLEIPPRMAEAVAHLSLAGAQGQVELRVINDRSFPELLALAQSPDGKQLYAASQTEDAVYQFEVATKKVTKLEVGDGPSALGVWTDAKKKSWLVVAHRFSPALLLLSLDDPKQRREVPGAAYAAALEVEGGVAFVAEQARDTVLAVGLDDGKERWRTPVLPNPRVLRATPQGLWVGSEEAGALERLDAKTGKVLEQLQPDDKTAIIGGGTANYARFTMGGSAPRAFAFSKKLSALLVASIGPNIGPNPDRMEVSMNGGVGLVRAAKGDAAHARFERHLGFGAGVTEALALDEKRGLLYAADVSLGLVRVLDVAKLGDDKTAGDALLQEVALPPPAHFPLVRAKDDFGVHNRAGVSLHSGPWALALSPDSKSLFVLDRFTGTLARLDVSAAAQKKAVWVEQTELTDVLAQPARRKGEVLFFADLGRTAMSCDACHPDGHMGDVMFEKTKPLRVYRVPTVRGARFSPPYFTPASTFSMGETAEVVGGRNRFHNPNPTVDEINALSIYSLDLTLLPNPFVGDDGAPPETLALPDGKTGHPRKGIAAFEKAQCQSCHPPPHFTTDQDPKTRGKYLDVGTPHLMPLREKLQDAHFEGFAVPPLVGQWDVWPMLTTGLAGWKVGEGGQLVVDDRFPLRKAVEGFPGHHGHPELLSPEEKDDLLAWLMTL